jgi:hypothetical protein
LGGGGVGADGLRHDLGDEAGLAECFEGMVAVDTAGRLDTAAELLATSAALRERTGSQASTGEAAAITAMLREVRKG